MAFAPDDYVNDFFARFPGGPFRAAELSSPSMEKIGIGVTLVPTDISKSDGTAYAMAWVLQDRTPPNPEAPKAGCVLYAAVVHGRGAGGWNRRGRRRAGG